MAKLRRTRSRRQPITQAAVAAYEAATQAGLVEVRGQAALICDDALAAALGVPALVWWPHGGDLVERLEQAARADGVFVGD